MKPKFWTRMKPKSRVKTLAASAAAIAVALTVVLVPSAAVGSTGATFTVAQAWGTIPDDFNPYATSGSTAPGTDSAIYQSLFYINDATGAVTPMLGTSYKWTNSKTLTVTTRTGVTWSDGQPFSAADVAFTFNYLKTYPALDLNGVWSTSLSSVTATGPNTVVFSFSKPDTPAALNILYGTDGSSGEEAILPQHIWSTITDPTTYTNPNPVGTGPFVLSNFSASSVTYTKNPNYWEAGKPTIGTLVLSSVDSDTTAELELENGTIDMTYDYLTDAQKTFVDQDPSTNVYFWPSVSGNYLYINTAKAPYNTVTFRKAIAESMDTPFLASRAYFGALTPDTGGAETALVSPQVSQWFEPSLKGLEYSYSVSKAKALLRSLGYSWKGGKLIAKSGKAVPSQTVLIGGPGWTDYISLADNVASELKAIGISATVIQEPYSTYANDLDKGNYDVAISWGNNNGSTPYYQYYDMFAPKQSAPIGKVATTDWERYTSPAITKALDDFSSASTTKAQKSAIDAIEKNVLQNVPVVPLTGRGDWLDYQTGQFTGFPSKSDPYNDGSAGDQEGAQLVYLNVVPKA
jgi:peptide/nickel transport system substrate-binding protein